MDFGDYESLSAQSIKKVAEGGMLKVLASVMVLIGGSIGFLCAQARVSQDCAAPLEFAPTLVLNRDLKVTFKCDYAAPLDLIRAVGQQTRIPIGVVLGEDADALSKPVRSYELEGVNARDALLMALEGTGYSLEEKDHVMVLRAGDVTQRQDELLTHRFSNFGSSNATMVEMGAGLTGWVWTEVDGAKGYGGSILGSTNDERFTLKPIPEATMEEIANRIVSLGSKGMWIFRAAASDGSDSSADGVEVEPYQHYSNRPSIER